MLCLEQHTVVALALTGGCCFCRNELRVHWMGHTSRLGLQRLHCHASDVAWRRTHHASVMIGLCRLVGGGWGSCWCIGVGLGQAQEGQSTEAGTLTHRPSACGTAWILQPATVLGALGVSYAVCCMQDGNTSTAMCRAVLRRKLRRHRPSGCGVLLHPH